MLVELPWNLHDGANPVPTGSTECLQLTHPEPVLEDDGNKTRGKKLISVISALYVVFVKYMYIAIYR